MLTQWYTSAITFLPNLVLIAIILALAIWLARRSQLVVLRLAERTQAPNEIGILLGRGARFTVLAFGVLLVLDRLNLSGAVLSFITGLGIAGIIIGFALQDIVKQFAAGVLLLMLRPFRVGDDVRIGAFEGRVMQVQLRATVLKTAGGDEVQIPNADVYSTAIINSSRYEQRRRTLALSLPANADLAEACASLLRAVAEVPGVARNPAPEIVAIGLAEQAVQLEARFWVAQSGDLGAVQTDVIAAMRRELAKWAGA